MKKHDQYTFTTHYQNGTKLTRVTAHFNDDEKNMLLTDNELKALIETVEKAKNNRWPVKVKPALLEPKPYTVHESRTLAYAVEKLKKSEPIFSSGNLQNQFPSVEFSMRSRPESPTQMQRFNSLEGKLEGINRKLDRIE